MEQETNFHSPYLSMPARLEKVIEETSNIKTFVIRPEGKFSFDTGQFIELSAPGVGEAPFTPSSSPAKTETIEVTVMKAGAFTSHLHELKKGALLGIRGPYGKGYPVKDFFGKEVLILGGGVGIAPLRSFLLTLLDDRKKFKRLCLCYGTKKPEDIVYKHLFSKWQKTRGLEVLRSVDTCPIGAWDENIGLVTCLLDKLTMDTQNAVAVLCGPPIMMKFSTLKLLEKGFAPKNIYLSMEANMSCGLGKCGHCQLGSHFVCKDGPVFTWEQIKDLPNPF